MVCMQALQALESAPGVTVIYGSGYETAPWAKARAVRLRARALAGACPVLLASDVCAPGAGQGAGLSGCPAAKEGGGAVQAGIERRGVDRHRGQQQLGNARFAADKSKLWHEWHVSPLVRRPPCCSAPLFLAANLLAFAAGRGGSAAPGAVQTPPKLEPLEPFEEHATRGKAWEGRGCDWGLRAKTVARECTLRSSM